MLVIQIFVQQAPSAPPASARDEVREQVRQTIQDATMAARDAARDAARADAAGQGQRQVTITRDGKTIVVGPDGPFGPVVAGIPGIGQHPYDANNVVPPQAVDIAMGFFVMLAVIIVGYPLARAFGRRVERRSEVAVMAPALTEQLQRIEQAVEAMSIEVERISESQRFLTKLQSAAQPERIGQG